MIDAVTDAETCSCSNLQCHDDYVAAVRFTPRDLMLTDVEILWPVRADTKCPRPSSRRPPKRREPQPTIPWGALVIDDISVDFSNRVYGHSAQDQPIPGQLLEQHAPLVRWFRSCSVPPGCGDPDVAATFLNGRASIAFWTIRGRH